MENVAADLDAAQAEIERLESELKGEIERSLQLQSLSQKLESTVKDSTRERDDALKEIGGLRGSVDRLKAELQTESSELSDLRKAHDGVMNDYEALKHNHVRFIVVRTRREERGSALRCDATPSLSFSNQI